METNFKFVSIILNTADFQFSLLEKDPDWDNSGFLVSYCKSKNTNSFLYFVQIPPHHQLGYMMDAGVVLLGSTYSSSRLHVSFPGLC